MKKIFRTPSAADTSA